MGTGSLGCPQGPAIATSTNVRRPESSHSLHVARLPWTEMNGGWWRFTYLPSPSYVHCRVLPSLQLLWPFWESLSLQNLGFSLLLLSSDLSCTKPSLISWFISKVNRGSSLSYWNTFLKKKNEKSCTQTLKNWEFFVCLKKKTCWKVNLLIMSLNRPDFMSLWHSTYSLPTLHDLCRICIQYFLYLS